MCRHLAYLGPETDLSTVVLTGANSLLRQTWAPTDMRGGGTVNVDGFGLAWYPPGSPTPRRYRRAVPMWTDESLPALADSLRGTAILAAIRSGTVGMPVVQTACAPFADGRWSFSHNGIVAGWPDTVTGLAARLPIADLLTLDAPIDSVLVWALVRDRLRAGDDPAQAITRTVLEVDAVAPGSRLNLLLTDGHTVIASTWSHALSILDTGDSVVVSSEPLTDDPRWTAVADRHLVVAELTEGITTVTTTPIERSTTPTIEIHLPPDHAARALANDVRAGLSATPKSLPPKWFYDAVGSELFEEITRLPEYYPTRAEREILATHAADIAEATGAHTLVELGSGSSEKTRLLLDALRETGTLRQLVALDVSESALREAAAALHTEYPDIEVHGVVGDFTEHLARLSGEAPRLVAFLGGTIGNLLPDERAKFLSALRDTLTPGEWVLLGTDLVKDPAVLVPAYDDERGVTARFNRNVLRVLNRELGADLDVEAFEHVALWDAEHEWIEMRLRATRAMTAHIPPLGMTVSFEAGEEIRTEISGKFRRERVAGELAEAGFELADWWTDRAGRFAVSLAKAAG